MACAVCNNFARKLQRDYRISWDCTLQQLDEAARRACAVCFALLEGITHFDNPESVRRISVWGPSIDDGQDGSLEVEVFLAGPSAMKTRRLQFFPATEAGAYPFKNIKRLPTIPGNTASVESFEWARRTLQNCIETHSHSKPWEWTDDESRLSTDSGSNTDYTSRQPTFVRANNQDGLEEAALEDDEYDGLGRWSSEDEADGPSQRHDRNQPTRLLDLEAFDEELDIKITTGKNAFSKGQYACLSHCWGQERHLTTIKANLKDHEERIPWSSLPQTFQDAIHFARRLCLRYMWIDSLCILQDDEADWLKESAMMSSIYSNAYLTIAATRSSGDSGGCYSTGSSSDKDYLIKITGYNPKLAALCVREKTAHLDGTSPSAGSPVPFPLLSRGWFYQERLLSPRVLHFGPKEFLWECEELTTCECGGSERDASLRETWTSLSGLSRVSQTRVKTLASSGLPVDSRQLVLRQILSHLYHPFRDAGKQDFKEIMQIVVRLKHRLSLRDHQRIIELVGDDLDELDIFRSHGSDLISAWHKLVDEYSALRLTKRKDRLPAVSGLAAQYQQLRFPRYFSPYLYGLWKDSLLHDLLWRVDEPLCGRSEQRSDDPAHPSWSWASVNGRVTYWPEKEWDSDLQILETSSSFHTLKPGESPCIEFLGRLTPATLRYTSTDTGVSNELFYELAYGGTHVYMQDTHDDVDWSDKIRFSSAGRVLTLHADYCLSKGAGDRLIANGQLLYCLGNFVGQSFTASLVLREKTDDGYQLVYERVGITKIPHEGRKVGEKLPFVAVARIDPKIPRSKVIVV